ncbi:MAG: NAD(P)/FAD-dependent oxidoreductase, partial [bacterium]
MYDVIIAGGGPAGLSAALMLGRCRRRVLLCDLRLPRNRHSHGLHGYLTRDGIAPLAFNDLGRAELEQYGVEVRVDGVTSAQWHHELFHVHIGPSGEELSRFLLLATGVVDDLPAIPGLHDCYGHTVFHCPYCDGWERRDRPLAAFGHGKTCAGLALALKTWSADVVMCTHGGRID